MASAGGSRGRGARAAGYKNVKSFAQANRVQLKSLSGV